VNSLITTWPEICAYTQGVIVPSDNTKVITNTMEVIGTDRKGDQNAFILLIATSPYSVYAEPLLLASLPLTRTTSYRFEAQVL
jgi:hypothetical protein